MPGAGLLGSRQGRRAPPSEAAGVVWGCRNVRSVQRWGSRIGIQISNTPGPVIKFHGSITLNWDFLVLGNVGAGNFGPWDFRCLGF